MVRDRKCGIEGKEVLNSPQHENITANKEEKRTRLCPDIPGAKSCDLPPVFSGNAGGI
jgi:hypothetical protein